MDTNVSLTCCSAVHHLRTLLQPRSHKLNQVCNLRAVARRVIVQALRNPLDDLTPCSLNPH